MILHHFSPPLQKPSAQQTYSFPSCALLEPVRFNPFYSPTSPSARMLPSVSSGNAAQSKTESHVTRTRSIQVHLSQCTVLYNQTYITCLQLAVLWSSEHKCALKKYLERRQIVWRLQCMMQTVIWSLSSAEGTLLSDINTLYKLNPFPVDSLCKQPKRRSDVSCFKSIRHFSLFPVWLFQAQWPSLTCMKSHHNAGSFVDKIGMKTFCIKHVQSALYFFYMFELK